MRSLLTLVMFAAVSTVLGQNITREEYILKYKDIAIDHMERYGIPASIKMAQALLESDNGNSRLAREGNNHFGIKCRAGWAGETITHDDDAAGECFRKYDSADDSFIDHSNFLDNSPRYQSLFKLNEKDYKGWAYGLKEAGYATNPTYPQLLIKIIEDNNLHLLDQGVKVAYSDIKTPTREIVIDTTKQSINVDNVNITIDRRSGREIRYNNGVKYIIALTGDSYASIAMDFGISISRLLAFNDLKFHVQLRAGDALYVSQKSKRSENGYLLYTIEKDETMHEIAQKFGIRVKNLYKINNMSEGTQPSEGIIIRLR